eukprot:53434-Eustigmatos_ZCMA.PRE.1
MPIAPCMYVAGGAFQLTQMRLMGFDYYVRGRKIPKEVYEQPVKVHQYCAWEKLRTVGSFDDEGEALEQLAEIYKAQNRVTVLKPSETTLEKLQKWAMDTKVRVVWAPRCVWCDDNFTALKPAAMKALRDRVWCKEAHDLRVKAHNSFGSAWREATHFEWLKRQVSAVRYVCDLAASTKGLPHRECIM